MQGGTAENSGSPVRRVCVPAESCSNRVGSYRLKVLQLIERSGHYMYRQFNIQQFYVLPTQCIYVFCVDLRTNSHYFPIQHKLTGLYKRNGVCLLRGTDWTNSDYFPIQH